MGSVIISVCSLTTAGQMGCSLWAHSGPGGCESPIVLPSPGRYKTSRAFQFSFIPLLSVPISFWSPGPGKDAEVTAVNTLYPQPHQGPQKGFFFFFFIQTQSPELGVHSCDDLHSFEVTLQQVWPHHILSIYGDGLSPTQAWPPLSS